MHASFHVEAIANHFGGQWIQYGLRQFSIPHLLWEKERGGREIMKVRLRVNLFVTARGVIVPWLGLQLHSPLHLAPWSCGWSSYDPWSLASLSHFLQGGRYLPLLPRFERWWKYASEPRFGERGILRLTIELLIIRALTFISALPWSSQKSRQVGLTPYTPWAGCALIVKKILSLPDIK